MLLCINRPHTSTYVTCNGSGKDFNDSVSVFPTRAKSTPQGCYHGGSSQSKARLPYPIMPLSPRLNLCSKPEQECCTERTSVPGAGPAQSYPRGHRRSRGQSDSSSEGAGESRQMHARAVLHIIELSSHHQRNWGSLKWPTVHVPRTPHSILKWRALKTVKYWIWKGSRVWAHTVQNNLILWALFSYFFYISTSFWK